MEVLRAALGWASSGQASPGGRHASANGLILGCEPNERALRFGLERSYRALARLTSDRSRRIELVDMANAIRPKTRPPRRIQQHLPRLIGIQFE